jgi:transcriptional regulator with XRE-family HTH domain
MKGGEITVIMELGKNIRKTRKANRMKTVRLAAITGVKPQFISQIENGKRLPSLNILQKIASALNTTTSELLGETPEILSTDMKRLVDAAGGLSSQQMDVVISVVKEMSGKYHED